MPKNFFRGTCKINLAYCCMCAEKDYYIHNIYLHIIGVQNELYTRKAF